MNAHFDLTPESRENVNGIPHSDPGISAPSRVFVHAKLQMTQSGDPEEREADEIADTVLRDGRIARSVSPGSSGGGVAVPSQYGERLSSLQGHGSRLYGDLKDRMESGFGRDFSDVRLHTDNDAAEMSDGISARAFTLGSDIYFNRGEFNPGTRDGQHLLAHELAHVTQQNGKISRQEASNMSSELVCSEEDEKKKNDIRKYISPSFKKELPGFDLLLEIPKVQKKLNALGLPSLKAQNLLHLFELNPDYQRKMIENMQSSDLDTAKRYREKLDNYQIMTDEFESRSISTLEAAENGKREPVTVAIRMAVRSDHNGAFIKPDYYSIADHLIVLQEVEDIQTCTELLQYIDKNVGPIQNLIISGHGNPEGIILNENQSFSIGESATYDFTGMVNGLMPEDDGSGMVRSVFLDSCSTNVFNQGKNASLLNFAQYFRSRLKWSEENLKEHFISANATLNETEIKIESDELKVTDDNREWIDDTTSYQTRTSISPEPYTGPEASDPIAHLAEIDGKFNATSDYETLKNDLAVFDHHFHWKNPIPRELQHDKRRAMRLIDSIRKCISYYFKNKPKNDLWIRLKILSNFHDLTKDPSIVYVIDTYLDHNQY